MQSLAAQILSQLLLAIATAEPAGAAQDGRPMPELLAQADRSSDRPAMPAAAPPRKPTAAAAPQNAALPATPQAPPAPTAGQTGTEPSGHDYRTAVAQYERLSAEERKHYVERLIQGRLQAAAQLTLDDAALAAKRKSTRKSWLA